MELNITAFVREQDMFDFSHSAAEGGHTAGTDTWRAAIAASPTYMFVNDATRDDIRDWVAEFGAWDRDEIDAWSDVELDALLLQFAAGDVRGMEDADDAAEPEGRVYRDENHEWFMYIGR